MSTTNYNSYYTCYIATASIAVATEYNKNPDADFIAIEHEDMDVIVEYFKDHAFYKYNTDLTMDGQLKFKGKPVIEYIGQPVKASKMSDSVKEMLNSIYGANKFYKEATGV